MKRATIIYLLVPVLVGLSLLYLQKSTLGEIPTRKSNRNTTGMVGGISSVSTVRISMPKLEKSTTTQNDRNSMVKLEGIPTSKTDLTPITKVEVLAIKNKIRKPMPKLEEPLNMTIHRKPITKMQETYTIKTDRNSMLKSEEFPSMKVNRTPTVKNINFWNSVWRDYRWPMLPEENTDVHCGTNATCRFYSNNSQPLLYDALVFHGRYPQEPPTQRSAHQTYIIYLEECPAYRGDYYIHGGQFYNWSITYSRTSDFVNRYFKIVRCKPESNDANNNQHTGNSSIKGQGYKLKQLDIIMHHSKRPGEAFVFWVVSHCETYSRRERYVDVLKRHVAVDIYGKCGQDCRPLENSSGKVCHEALATSGQYKFYLAFENSACREYITEKVFEALKFGLVPIVFGGLTTDDYTALLPPGSFIDVRNFTSPKYLAEYLLYLENNDKAYLGYHGWREEWEVVGGVGGLWCEVCRAVHNTVSKPHTNIDWGKFWDPQTECDNNLLQKAMSSDLSHG